MSRIFVTGIGAVSPAGWGVAPLRAALENGTPLPAQPLARPGWEKPFPIRAVPDCTPRLPCMAHARLRRTSPITQYATAAALEALGSTVAPGERVGLILCLQSGCVQYSYRFYDEVLKDPSTASPLIFPETVLAAPVSHIAAVLGNVDVVQTLIGDPANFLQGVAIGADWLLSNRIDACVVIGADEINWLLANALWLFDHRAILSGGAGALCLRRAPGQTSIELDRITDPWTYSATLDRTDAAKRMREQLAPAGSELLCDGAMDSALDTPELAAWKSWNGPRVSPKKILGEGFMAAAGWQCVAACDAMLTGRATSAIVSLVGCNQQAIAARFK